MNNMCKVASEVPWHVERFGGRYELWPVDKGQTHCFIGTVQTSTDAQFIVTACNGWQSMVDALSLSKATIERLHADLRGANLWGADLRGAEHGPMCTCCAATLSVIDAALANATKPTP